MRPLLVPEHHAGVIIAAWHLCAALCALVLDFHLEGFLKPDRIRDVPAVNPVLTFIHLDVPAVQRGRGEGVNLTPPHMGGPVYGTAKGLTFGRREPAA